MQWSGILEAMTFYHSIDSGKLDQRKIRSTKFESISAWKTHQEHKTNTREEKMTQSNIEQDRIKHNKKKKQR